MTIDSRLIELADEVDVIDLAGHIIANPRRARVSLAGQLALAHAYGTASVRSALTPEIVVGRCCATASKHSSVATRSPWMA